MAEAAADMDLQVLTAYIVSAYVVNNKLDPGELAALIGSTHDALSAASAPAPEAPPEAPRPDKAAVKKSVSHEHLISFIDGRRYKSLKRHLTTQGLTPDAYRERYGLPKAYPMVAASYSAQRSALALTLGLGRKLAGEGTSTAAEPADAPKPTRRGRKAATADAG